MRRHLRFSQIILAAAVAPIFFLHPAFSADTLRLAHVAPANSSFQVAAERLDKHLQAASKGAMALQIFPASQLGGFSELWAKTRDGTLDIHLIDLFAVQLLKSGRDFNVLSMPYLVRDAAHWGLFVRSDIFRQMNETVEKGEGLKYLGYLGDRPARALTTRTKPVRRIEDIKGLRIRTPEGLTFVAAMKAFGASPVPLKASDLHESLRTGAVEGQDNGIIDVATSGIMELQTYYSPIDYMHSGVSVWTSARVYDALGAERQAQLAEAIRRTFDESSKALAKETEDAIRAAKAKGMIFLDVDLAGFRAAGTKLMADFDGKTFTKGLAERIGALR